MYKIRNNDEINDNDYNANNVRNKIENRKPFAEGDGGFLYKEPNNKVRKVFKSKFAFDGESNVYEKTGGLYNVVKVYKILKRNMHIIMEFVPYNLENLIVGKEDKDFDKFDKSKIVNELISGLISLHERDIYHNDYKAKNIQITTDSSVRIIDFDLSDFGVQNSKKRIDEINKLKYIILQILFKEKYYPDFYNNRNNFLENIDDVKFKKVMTFKRDNLKEMQKYMGNVDFNNSGTLINDTFSLISGAKKIYYLENVNVKKQNSKVTKTENVKKTNIKIEKMKKPNTIKVKKENVKKEEVKPKLTKSILDKFFTEFKFKNEKECSSGSHSSYHFIKKPVLIKTINKKYPEIREELPNGYQKLPKDKLCEEIYKLKIKYLIKINET